MTVCVYIVIALLVVTKLCDVASTLQRIVHPDGETNPIARQVMIRVGTTKAVWIVLVLALIIIGLASGAAIKGGNIRQALFIFAGLAISIIQGSVAYCNWTGRDNVITKRARILHASLLRIIPR